MMYKLETPSAMRCDRPTEWRVWKKRYERFNIASKLIEESEEIQINTFIYCMGLEAEKIFESFVFEGKEEKDFDKIVEKFDNHFKQCTKELSAPIQNIPEKKYIRTQKSNSKRIEKKEPEYTTTSVVLNAGKSKQQKPVQPKNEIPKNGGSDRLNLKQQVIRKEKKGQSLLSKDLWSRVHKLQSELQNMTWAYEKTRLKVITQNKQIDNRYKNEKRNIDNCEPVEENEEKKKKKEENDKRNVYHRYKNEKRNIDNCEPVEKNEKRGENIDSNNNTTAKTENCETEVEPVADIKTSKKKKKKKKKEVSENELFAETSDNEISPLLRPAYEFMKSLRESGRIE